MLQFSVYGRTARNYDDAAKHVSRLEKHMPPEGSVRTLAITEKQYAGMYPVFEENYANESYLDSKSFVEL